jgi:hypothetical protein
VILKCLEDSLTKLSEMTNGEHRSLGVKFEQACNLGISSTLPDTYIIGLPIYTQAKQLVEMSTKYHLALYGYEFDPNSDLSNIIQKLLENKI